MDYIKPIQYKAERNDENESTFYAYNFNNWRVWFTQHDNGHISSVSAAKDGEPWVGTSVTRDCMEACYPNRFLVCASHEKMTTEEMRNYIPQLEEAMHIMDSVEYFLYHSSHYELFCRNTAQDALESANLGDYDLDGVEFTDDDVDTLTQYIMNNRDPEFVHALVCERNHDIIAPIVHGYLSDIRDILDIGLE